MLTLHAVTGCTFVKKCPMPRKSPLRAVILLVEVPTKVLLGLCTSLYFMTMSNRWSVDNNYSRDMGRSRAYSGDDYSKHHRRRRRESSSRDNSLSPLQKRRRSPLQKTEYPNQESLKEGISSSVPNDGTVFVWKKKVEQERKQGRVVTAETEAARVRMLREELVEAQRQRARRDAERAEWEKEMRKESRRREQERNADERQAEVSFAGRQYFARQAIRLRENRPNRIDEFSRVVRLDVPGVDNTSPDTADDVINLIHGIPASELKDILDTMDDELDFIPDFPTNNDSDAFNRSTRLHFWQAVRAVIADCARMHLDGGVHASVQAEVDTMLRGKSPEKLSEMELEIVARLQPDIEDDPDFGEADFWTAALSQIKSLLAVHRLKDIVLQLRAERAIRASRQHKTDVENNVSKSRDRHMRFKENEMVLEEAAKGMGENEEAFTEEVEVKPSRRSHDAIESSYARNDKFRPRKPLYFNRVHTGYNWTKYNRTHYDHDNPPPKTVQGYKFNIFYPDLIDTSKTPSYHISKTDNPDVCIITFKAGPPYLDIAFKIVDRPWERSHKRGYRCSFDRGVLQLWFYFQRYRYRR